MPCMVCDALGNERCRCSNPHRCEPQTARRFRNIVSALENLITQLDGWKSDDEFARELRLAHRLYKAELEYHQRVQQ